MNDQLNRMKQSQVDTRKMLAEWRENNFNEVQLSLSNRVLKVRDVGLIDMAIEGKLPNTMLDLVQQLNDGKISEAQMMSEHAPELGALLDMIFKLAVVFPPVADESDDDHISPKDFVYGDKMALFKWVNREAVVIRPFRREPDEPMADTPDRKNLRKKAK
jgi:hypothetical protein